MYYMMSANFFEFLTERVSKCVISQRGRCRLLIAFPIVFHCRIRIWRNRKATATGLSDLCWNVVRIANGCPPMGTLC
jgi:hypothetical protein